MWSKAASVKVICLKKLHFLAFSFASAWLQTMGIRYQWQLFNRYKLKSYMFSKLINISTQCTFNHSSICYSFHAVTWFGAARYRNCRYFVENKNIHSSIICMGADISGVQGTSPQKVKFLQFSWFFKKQYWRELLILEHCVLEQWQAHLWKEDAAAHYKQQLYIPQFGQTWG